jgi:hypothetical protein
MDKEYLTDQLNFCKQEHKNLDNEIFLLLETPVVDDLLIHRLKKKKLMLKDQIRMIESKLMNDIIA